ncbi:MAG TPA: hypothetical protein VJX16_27105 [Terriglobales bacterium]|nr:hypothetical protein [Terriglobales bacterium]
MEKVQLLLAAQLGHGTTACTGERQHAGQQPDHYLYQLENSSSGTCDVELTAWTPGSAEKSSLRLPVEAGHLAVVDIAAFATARW